MMAGMLVLETKKPLNVIMTHALRRQPKKAGRGGRWWVTSEPKVVPASASAEAIERSMAPVKMIPVSANPARATGAISGALRSNTSEKELPCLRSSQMASKRRIFPASKNARRRRTPRVIRLNTRELRAVIIFRARITEKSADCFFGDFFQSVTGGLKDNL